MILLYTQCLQNDRVSHHPLKEIHTAYLYLCIIYVNLAHDVFCSRGQK